MQTVVQVDRSISLGASFASRVLSGSFAISGTPVYIAAIPSTNFYRFLGKEMSYVRTKRILLLQTTRTLSFSRLYYVALSDLLNIEIVS